MKKIRKVAYVRVSTAQKAQLHSYEFQEEYWRTKLAAEPDTDFIGVYADKGISGCSMKRRPQFMTMMQDAREGKFDEIHTKSVSRFSRNTMELLQAVRELRDLGIRVVFEKENIDTLQAGGELILTIAAAIAESELQADSDRQRWSLQHRIQNGWISVGGGLYGYRMTESNDLEIVEEEAAVIRRIFQMYLNGAGSVEIAKALNADGLRTQNGKEWTSFRILETIVNEKYMGDCIMGKSVVVKGIKLDNDNGTLGQRFYIEDTHEGLVSKEDWQQAQAIRESRIGKRNPERAAAVYPFTRVIECAQCGCHYRHKINNCGKKYESAFWGCETTLIKGIKACDSTRIKDTVLQEKFVEAYNEFITTRPQGTDVTAMQASIRQLRESERSMAVLAMQRLIPEAAFRAEQQQIKAQIADLTAKLNELRSKYVCESDFTHITEFDPTKVEQFITKVIMSKNMVTFVFYNGATITKAYTNGKGGNKPGWNKKEA